MLRKLPEPDDNFRVESADANVGIIRHDFVPPLPVGSFVVQVFRIEDYREDFDGSALATLQGVDFEGNENGLPIPLQFLGRGSYLVVDAPGDLLELVQD